jgi:hypothetical protein
VKTEGTWVVGFEKNDFFEGQQRPRADMMWTKPTASGLIVDDKVQEKVAPAGPHIYAFQVNVVGRRPLCPIGIVNPYPVVVQQLKIIRRIGTH